MVEFGPTVVHEPQGKHSATFIMLHGLGDTADGWAPSATAINLPHVKFIFPTAPTRPITVDLGQGSGGLLPGWFDITAAGEEAFRDAMDGKLFDPEGTEQALKRIQDLIDAEVAVGTPKDRIVIGGFSQAGFLALKTHFAQTDSPLGACVALCTWLNPQGLQVPEAVKSKPVFLCHGTGDTVIPYAIGEETRDLLREAGVRDIEFKTYPGLDHVSSPEMILDIKAFLLRAIPHL